jgi:hypothetical protein
LSMNSNTVHVCQSRDAPFCSFVRPAHFSPCQISTSFFSARWPDCRIFARWPIVLFWAVLWKNIFRVKSVALIFDKKWVGPFLHKLVRSSCFHAVFMHHYDV